MSTIKCLLYCTREKPYLVPNGYYEGKTGEWCTMTDKEWDFMACGDEWDIDPEDAMLNGTVCFECEIEKAEEIYFDPILDCFMTKTFGESSLEKRSCLSNEELNDYSPKHALYLKNVKAIKPFPITGVARRDPTGLNIAEGLASGMLRAPQNMCWAWRWNDKGWERVLVLSLRPKNLCNIANGLKDIETRRVVVKEIKEKENEKAI